MRKNGNSAFANLAISYVTVVMVMVLLLCSIFYMYFPKHYNEEIQKKNQIILESTANYIESSVLQRVQQIYLDLSLGEPVSIDIFAKATLQGNHGSVLDLQDLLKNEVADYADIVSAVHLFYPGPNIMISSDAGLRYLDHERESAATAWSWVDRLQKSGSSFVWTEASKTAQDMYTNLSDDKLVSPVISYAHSYPFHSTGADCDLMIAIDMKEEAISGIIRHIMPSDYKNTFVIGPSGTIISAADKEILGHSAGSGYINKILSSTAVAASFTDKMNQGSNEVSFHTFPSNNWKIYNITSTDNYYQKSILLQRTVLLICLLAVIVGMVLSGVFTVAIYNPLKRLRDKMKGMFDHTPEPGLNEYTLIDTAINKLTRKVSSLEETLQANSPVIKHNIVLNLLNNSYSDEELVEQLQSIHIPMTYAHYCCMLIDPVSPGFKTLNSQTMQYVLYRMINQLEAADYAGSHIIAEELPDKKVAVIVCTDLAEDELLEQISGFILSEVKHSFDLEFRISLGCWVQRFMDVHRSFDEAKILAKYGFLLPEVSIIKDARLLERESSTNEIPQAVLLKFKEKLQARNIEEITEAIEQLLGQMREGMYSADYCRYIMLNTVSVYSDYLISVRYTPSDHVKINLYNEYTSIHDINGYRKWLTDSIAVCMVHMEKRSDNRTSESIEAVKHYISTHLSEELSLDTVAGKVFLSPKYLSKIFKEETGMNYIEYVTEKRMEKALELMAKHDMTIEQIANTVGYGTTAYFIKKFKEKNGYTPKHYIRQLMEQS
ncbi:helix-turn-helix domain-containing protein [Paenibacillus sp. sgz5001063]|uniref:helix-turn-helix domain-containing protein n=1 Tax=Paenibacillus sp. sgz5001063 TaxID=3242474 RepID=UPI0036D2EB2A